MDANAAGIIGLLLGGAGGYYGGKKRADRKARDLEKLIALYGGEDDEIINKALDDGTSVAPGAVIPGYVSGADELLDEMTGKSSGSPAATDYLESYMDPNSPDYDPQSIFNPADYFDDKTYIPFNPYVGVPDGYNLKGPRDYMSTFLRGSRVVKNDGGRVGLKDGGMYDLLGGKDTSGTTKLTLLDALTNFQGADSLFSFLGGLASLGVGMNDGGRVGYEQGGIVDLYKKMNHE